MPQSKPIDDLTADDLRLHPIWEYAMDEEDEHDETYVTPVFESSVPHELHVVYHAACDITDATGNTYSAFMSICNGELHADAPVVVCGPGSYWPLDLPYTGHQLARFEALFGVAYGVFFPVQWQLRVSVAGESGLRSGVYHGG